MKGGACWEISGQLWRLEVALVEKGVTASLILMALGSLSGVYVACLE